jgi:serine/threonine protein kinase
MAIPQRLGEYEIRTEIGRSALSVVYLASGPASQKPVAIKQITTAWMASEEARARLKREAKATLALNHPNIVSVLDVAEDPVLNTPFIVMEYVPGMSFKDLIAQRVFVPFEKKLELLVQVCDGLRAAHARDLVHRDIKPGNILITEEGRVKIIDFGLVRFLRPGDVTQTLTQSGEILGTPYYMSPEQFNGTPVDVRTDIFSLGVVIYEFLSYCRPFEGTFDDLRMQIGGSVTSPSLNKALPGCAKELKELVSRCLSKNVNGRYKDCAELTEDLRAFKGVLPDRLAELRTDVESTRSALSGSFSESTPPTWSELLSQRFFSLSQETERYAAANTFDFGAVDFENDYGDWLLRSREIACQLEAWSRRLKEAQRRVHLFELSQTKIKGSEATLCMTAVLTQPLSHSPEDETTLLEVEGSASPAQVLGVQAAVTEVLDLQSKLDQLREAAQNHAEAGEYAPCLSAIEEASNLDPNEIEVAHLHRWVRLVVSARRHLDLKRYRKAIKESLAVLDLEPGNLEAGETKESAVKALQQRRRKLALAAASVVLVLTGLNTAFIRVPFRSTSLDSLKHLFRIAEEPPVESTTADSRIDDRLDRTSADGEALNRWHTELPRTSEAKARAARADSAKLATSTLEQGYLLERNAHSLFEQGQVQAAVEKLLGATETYGQAAHEAQDLSRKLESVEEARRSFESERASAEQFDAAKLAADHYQAGLRRAVEARALLLQSDFSAAKTGFQSAANAMEAARIASERIQQERDRQAIRQLIEKYESAFNGRSLAAIKLLWPSLSEVLEQRFEKDFRSQSLHLTLSLEGGPWVKRNKATAIYHQNKQVESVDGVKLDFRTRPTFSLSKDSGHWVITELSE